MQEIQYFTTAELLEALRRKHGGCTDYRIAKVLGLTTQAVSKLTAGHSIMSDETAIKAANELGISPVLAVVSVIRERAKSQDVLEILDSIPYDAFKASVWIFSVFVFSFFFSSHSVI